MDLETGWNAAWAAAGCAAPAGLLDELQRRYSEPHRHYHTMQHLGECMAAFAPLRALATRPEEIELALWFHDAIYDVTRPDNEMRSAELASAAMLAAGIGQECAQRVHALVMATCHRAVPAGIDSQLLVDVDLSILAAPEPRFAQYEQQIRAEYSYVPKLLFDRKRKEILAGFLARERIFSTPACFAQYEQAARTNLRAAVESC